MQPALAVPTPDGKGLSFASYDQQVAPWPQVTNLEPGKGAASLVLQMSDVARRVCVASGKGHIADNDGAKQILKISRGHFEVLVLNNISRGQFTSCGGKHLSRKSKE